VMAAVVGLPTLLGYWFLLLVLTWPAASISAAATSAATGHTSSGAAAGKHSRGVSRLHMKGMSDLVKHVLRLLLAVPGRVVEPPVLLCQQYLDRKGVCGWQCAGLDVWNMAYCWWWPVLREFMKFAIALAAAATTMRWPSMQAMLVLLLVVLASSVSWQVQPGCGTSMNRRLYVASLCVQSLALLVMLLTMQGVNSVVLGWVLLVLALVVALPVLCILFWLAYRCFSAAKQMTLTGHGFIAAELA